MTRKVSLRELESARRKGIGRLFLEARRDFHVRLRSKMQAVGLETHPSMLISAYIDTEGSRSTDIAARMGVKKQVAWRMVKDLEALGMVSREPDPIDGRAWLVTFTAEGLKYLKRMRRAIDEIENDYEQLVGSERYLVVREALRLIAYGEVT